MMEPAAPQELTAIAQRLSSELESNLYSCCVYGSAVRGNAINGISDINLLIVLNDSTAPAHQAVACALMRHPLVDPLITERGTLLGTARCFATKFASIQRNYRVLCGADPLADIAIDPRLERLLCEQGLRNLRLRTTYAFVMDGRGRDYREFVADNVSPIFVQLSDVLRLSDKEVPKDFAARIPLMAEMWRIERSILDDLLSLRRTRRQLAKGAAADWHGRLLTLIDAALRSVEQQWGNPTQPETRDV